MQTLLLPLRHAHRKLLELGPGFFLVALGKYRTEAAVLICSLCVLAALYDLLRRRWFDGALWLGSAGLVFAAFQGGIQLWSPRRTVMVAGGAIALAVVAVLRAFLEQLHYALEDARRERRKLRRIQPSAWQQTRGPRAR